MKTILLNRCSPQMKRILGLAKKDDVVLRTSEGDEILLSEIDDFDYEIAAQRRNKKLMAFLDEASWRARREKGIPLEKAMRRLGLDRRSGNISNSVFLESRGVGRSFADKDYFERRKFALFPQLVQVNHYEVA